jgi:PAS domain S-box-containing protein
MENNLILLEDLLTDSGYNVVSANNGKDALEKLHAEKEYDLIISDILMPVMDGFMLCKNMKRDEKLKNIPLVFYTASYIDEKDEVFALKLGVDKFIRKPIEPDELLKIVQGLLKDVDKDKIKSQEIVSENDKDVFRLYNERLVEKLEKKVLALENEIIERKRAEEALQRSNSLLSSVIESPDNVIIFVLDTSYNYLSFNTAHVKEMKKVYDTDIEIGQHILTYISREDDRLKAEKSFKRVLKGERFVKIEKYGQSNSRFWYELVFNPIYNNLHCVAGFTVFVTDITERKGMEEALLKSEKLNAIGIITAGISHEFNNLLAIISGNVQLLERTYKDHGDLTDVLRTIKRATDDGAEISGKMLEFTTTDQDTKEFVSSDIRDLIRQSIDFTMPRWKNEAQARGINYQMDTEGMKKVPSILCKPTELREVFINLINNALDAMPEGGSITFSTWSDDDTVFVGVSDTGEGMSEDVMKNIFDPFFTTKTPVGTGLGMSMAYGIITRHGGNIEVESEQWKGSTFTLQFPIATKAVSSIASPEPEPETNKKNLRILVVDDEEAICDILGKFLSGSGHKVKTVDNGADTINIIKVEDFDLVLCDLVMPDVSGHDVIKFLNELKKRSKIGIITGWGEKLKPIEEGMNVDFVIRKPFDFSELTKQINDLEF